MNNLSVADVSKNEHWAHVDQKDTQEVLIFLSNYGDPRMSKTKTGWYCKIELFVTGKGITFEVCTDFKQPTPLNAAHTCAELMLTALNDLTKKT